MTYSEEEARLNKVRIIIRWIGVSGLSDYQDQCIKKYLNGECGLCEDEIEKLIESTHEIQMQLELYKHIQQERKNEQNKIQ